MARRGGSWAAHLAAAVVAGSAGTTAAAPPFSSFAAQASVGRQAVAGPEAGPAAPAPLGTTSPFAIHYASPSADSPAAASGGPRPPIDELPVGPALRTAPAFAVPEVSVGQPVGQGVAVPEQVQPAAGGWVAAVGAFRRQGVYELAGDSITVGELVERCGGPSGDAAGTLRIVRNGRPLGPVYRHDDRLVPGDVVVAEERGSGQHGVTIAGYQAQAGPAAGPPSVRLGIVGLTDRPVAVEVPKAYAGVETLVRDVAGQRHLSPRDVTVLVGGSREVPGDQVGELTSGSVVVFDPRTVDTRAVQGNPPPTRYYPAREASAPSELPPAAIAQAAAQMSPALPVPPAPEAAPSATDPRQASGLSDAPAASILPPPSPDTGLSPLPQSVEMLDPPAGESRLRFPRTADASGSVPIGTPTEGGSHILPVPADALYPADAPAAATAMPDAAPKGLAAVEPIDLEADEEPAADEGPSFGDLVPTILIGGLLGGLTFFALRWLRGRPVIASLTDRILGRTIAETPSAAAIEPLARPPIASTRAAAPKSLTPAELLAALVADRLAFREEPVELPAALAVHGRSPALRKRRIDPPESAVPAPHVPLAAPAVPERTSAEATLREKVAAARRAGLRIDPAQPVAAPAAGLAAGTPFERALAARHEAARRGGA